MYNELELGRAERGRARLRRANEEFGLVGAAGGGGGQASHLPAAAKLEERMERADSS